MSDHVLRAGSTAHAEFTVDVDPERAGWTYTGLAIASLAAAESTTVETGEHEFLLLPLEGGYRVELDGAVFELEGRPTIWGCTTDYMYLPRHTTASVTAIGGGRIALPNALASAELPARYCGADEVRVELRGAGNCSRQVVNYAINNPLDTSRLLVCEVLTPGGNWSSYPPHKHDETTEEERELEEIYHFEVRGDVHGPGMAFHGTYGTSERPIEVAAVVASGDVALVPHGWHGPCAAAPGYDLYYLNVMAGPGGPEWRAVDDPQYGWLRETWNDEEIDPRLPLAVHGTEA